jgi:hypothetical protein
MSPTSAMTASPCSDRRRGPGRARRRGHPPGRLVGLAVEVADQRHQAVQPPARRAAQVECDEELAPALAEHVGMLRTTPCLARIAWTRFLTVKRILFGEARWRSRIAQITQLARGDIGLQQQPGRARGATPPGCAPTASRSFATGRRPPPSHSASSRSVSTTSPRIRCAGRGCQAHPAAVVPPDLRLRGGVVRGDGSRAPAPHCRDRRRVLELTPLVPAIDAECDVVP